MDLGIEGRVAIVTAASRGLGRGAALALAGEGARVLICARDPGRLEATRAQLPGEGHLAIAADVTDPATPTRLVEAAAERLGGVHIVVANAPGPPKARALEVEDLPLTEALNANLATSIRLARAAVPHMRRAAWGRICCITSSAVRQPIPDLSYSNVARAGLWAWAKTAAQDLAPDGITVNLACPGLHATDRVRELGHDGPLGDPEDFGRIVAFMCSEPAAFLSGTAIGVDGASTVGLL